VCPGKYTLLERNKERKKERYLADRRYRLILDSACFAKVDLLTEHALGRVFSMRMNSADYAAIYAVAADAKHRGVQ
jgi:hypothetical protein